MSAADAPDQLLARAAAAGDRAAFGTLVERYHSKVRGLLRHLSADASSADDLAQQSFLRAWERLSSFRGDSSQSFGAWLTRIAYREFLQRARRSKRENQLFTKADSDGDVIDEPAETEVADDRSNEADPSVSFSELVQCCTPEQAQALYMNFVLELTHEDIAVITSMPLGTVKSHISRGKSAIKASLQRGRQQESDIASRPNGTNETNTADLGRIGAARGVTTMTGTIRT